MSLTIVNVAYPFAPVGPDAVGGAEQVVASLDRALTARGLASVVVAAEGSVTRGELVPIPRSREPYDDATFAATRAAVATALARLVRERAVDVVHLHGIDFADYLPPPGPPVLATLHLPLRWYAAAALAPGRPDVFLQAVSCTQRARAPREIAICEVVPNGVDTSTFAPCDTPGDYVLALGRICPEKGFDLAARACRDAGLELVLGGRVFPYAAHERYFAEVLAPLLDETRRLVGPVGLERKRHLLARARCLVVPSLVDETSSLVAMEALASGTPVVGLRRGALPEIVEHGHTGLLVDDPRDLASALVESGRLDRGSCRRSAVERLGLARTTGRYLRLYERLARPRSRPRRPRQGWQAIEGWRELAAVIREWRALWELTPAATPFSRPEWLLPWARAFEPDRVVALARWQAGRLTALAPLCLAPGDACFKWLGVGVSDYGDALYERPEHLAELHDVLARELPGARVELDDVRPESPVVAALGAAPAVRVRAHEVALVLPLDGTEGLGGHVPAGLAAKLRYYQRRVARAGCTVRPAGAAEVAAGMRALFDLHERRWAARGGGVLADPRVRDLHLESAAAMQAAGLLRLYGLERQGRWVGAMYGWHAHGRAYFYLHGFDPDVADLSPGLVLIGQAIADAVRSGCTEFDFLRGCEPYKYGWGASERRLLRLEVPAGRISAALRA